jgi:hypothetical protein
MKTNYILLNLSVVLLSIFCDATQNNVNAQTRFNLGAGTVASGDGTGVFYSPAGTLWTGQNALELGFNLQPNKGGISGMNGSLKRKLTLKGESFNESTSVYAFISFIRQKDAYLSDQARKALETISPEFSSAQEVNYIISEAFIGFGLEQQILNRSSIYVDLGLGGYKTMKTNAGSPIPDEYKTYRSDNDVSLLLKAGYRFDCRSKK